MQVPKITRIAQTAKSVTNFYGYHHAPRIGDGEFYDERNLTSDSFPVLSIRKPRRRIDAYIHGAITGMLYLDYVWYTSGSMICCMEKNEQIDIGLTEGEKQLVAFGAYIIILPDNVYFNTKDYSDYGAVSKSAIYDIGTSLIDLMIVDKNGATPRAAIISESEPQDPALNGTWINPSDHELKKWTGEKWETVEYWLKIWFSDSAPLEEHGEIKEGDQIRFRAIGGTEWDEEKLNGLDGAVVTVKKYSADDRWIIVKHPVAFATLRKAADRLSFSSPMPIMDIIFEHNNRLWGCRYGGNVDGDFVNEIYASALGDFRSWQQYQGLSTDSYAMSCGAQGQWTGAAEVGGYPVFFKEHCLYKIYGDYPAQYSTDAMECHGVVIGGQKSIAIVNGAAYYAGVHGICRYDGTTPAVVSEALAEKLVGVGGAYGDKYILDATNGSCYVLDTVSKIWHKEDGLGAMVMAGIADELYYAEYLGDKVMRLGMASDLVEEESVPWMLETGLIGEEITEHKRLQRIDLRLVLPPGSSMRISVEYDSSGVWEPISSLMGRHLRSYCLPIRPKRCDHLRLKLEGEGDMRLHSISYITERGSDFIR